MSRECEIRLYHNISDCGDGYPSEAAPADKTIPVPVSEILPGKALPGWPFSCEAPVVEYYDGECMEVSFGGKTMRTWTGWKMIELVKDGTSGIAGLCGAECVCLRLGYVAPGVSQDFPAMFAHCSFNAVVRNFLTNSPAMGDATAVKRFLWVFICSSNMPLLDMETVAFLRSSAGKGNMYALFGMGRYHYYMQPDENSRAEAEACYRKAYAAGLPDAGAGLSQMYRYGDLGLVDRLRMKTFLAEAMEKKSEYATFIHLLNMISGKCGTKQDPAGALGIAEELIRSDTDNPYWHLVRAQALYDLKSYSASIQESGLAICSGSVDAWLDRALALSYKACDNPAELDPVAVAEGAEHRCHLCMYYQAIVRVADFDRMEEKRQEAERGRLLRAMKRAYETGSPDAAVYIGDIYHYGWYGVPVDTDTAHTWYAKAARLASGEAFEEMFNMAYYGEMDADRYFMDMCALNGARYGSEKMLNETVKAYRKGRLTSFASEIEQYYIPVFDAEEEAGDGDGDDDSPDDDGRYDAYV